MSEQETKKESKIKIGIPRALFYYSYYPFCKVFLEELGFEVIRSPKTTKAILQQGLNASNNELCLPIKLLYGHVFALKDKVDYIFLPYIISTHEGSYLCPKLIGSPDMLKANIPDLQMLSLDIDRNKSYTSLLQSLKELTFTLGVNPIKIYPAYKKAMLQQERFESYINKNILFDDALALLEENEPAQEEYIEIHELYTPKEKSRTYTFAIIGHTYVINDEYLSLEVIKNLKKRNIKVITSDALTTEQILESITILKRKTHWNLGNRVVGSALHFSKQEHIDGIIYITPFSCSSDSLLKEYIDAYNEHMPFMTLTSDEHAGDVGVLTRIEAFIDMIERKQLMKQDHKTEENIIKIKRRELKN